LTSAFLLGAARTRTPESRALHLAKGAQQGTNSFVIAAAIANFSLRTKTARSKVRFACVTFCMILCCRAASALQASPSHTVSCQAHQKRKKRHRILKLFERAPTADVVNTPTAPPLTTLEKLHLAETEFANPIAVAEGAAKAEFYRALEPALKIGQGPTGYARQFGAAYLDAVSGSMFSTFIYPTLFHQDPRYFRKAKGSIRGRVLYSFSRLFITRGDLGQKEFNWSEVFGAASVTALSSTYYPARERHTGIIATNIGWSMLEDGGTNAYDEFGPDLSNWMRKKWHRFRERLSRKTGAGAP
jgi:hypothetical protein